jgi:RHS repeat-associated protein
MIIAPGEPDAGTYLPVWNGHGDAVNLSELDPVTGTLTLANSYTYSTWGAPTTATHNGSGDLGFRFLYGGEFDVQWDAAFGLDLFYMHARHYSPALGRFLQPDPSAQEDNQFAYASNSPPTRIDPRGTLDRKSDSVGGWAASGRGTGGWRTNGKPPRRMPVVRQVKDVVRNPRMLCFQTPSTARQLISLALREGWTVNRLARGSRRGDLGSLRMYNRNAQLISYHPGGGHHGSSPYWKVSDGARTTRIGPRFGC